MHLTTQAASSRTATASAQLDAAAQKVLNTSAQYFSMGFTETFPFKGQPVIATDFSKMMPRVSASPQIQL